ncbi:transposase [Clostridium aceticum]|uniref:Transposase n=1 Tax=Clostridium aceticum TaxID=84022 RepID=A0A0G3WBV5_9CLOT|nr:transposase [Clostridium aceticum]AKL95828.1 transposase [Clostridium aceticum]
MPRKPRIHYKGALYHVMVRGNNREKVLQEEIQKKKYLDTVLLYKNKLGFKLYAYCMMDNHAHLLVEVEEVALSQIMQRIQQVYTKWFNREYNRTGHVFQQRYKALPLLRSKNTYLLQLIKYIHNNPIKAHIDKGLDYQWSSHPIYLGEKNGYVVDTNFVLSIFSSNKNKAISQYLQFMNQDQEEIIYEDMAETQKEAASYFPDKDREKFNKGIDEVIKKICKLEDITLEELTKKTKIQRISDIKKAIVLVNEKWCSMPKKVVAEKLNLPPSMVSKIVSGESKGTPYVIEVIKRWEEVSE